MIALLLALAVQERIGTLEYKPPAGWIRDGDLWKPKGGDGSAFFLWQGPVKKGDATLEQALQGYANMLDQRAGLKPLKGSGIRPMTLPLQAVSQGREVQDRASKAAYSLEVAILCEGEVYFFLFMTQSAEKFSALAKSDIEPMLRSAAAASAPLFEFGAIRFRAPEGWFLDPSTGAWTNRGTETGVDTVRWRGPVKSRGALESHFAAFREGMDGKAKPRKVTPPAAFKTRGGISGVWDYRALHYESSWLDDHVLDALVESKGLVHYFRFQCGDAKRYQETLKKMQAHLDSVAEFTPAPAEDRGTLELPKSSGATMELSRCCLRLAAPAAWSGPKEVEERAYYFAYQSKRKLDEKESMIWPVVVEVRIGETSDPREALRAWIGDRLFPELKGRRIVITSRAVESYRTWKLSTGTEVAAMTVRDYQGAPCLAVMDAMLLRGNGCLFLIGSGCGAQDRYPGLSQAQAAAAWSEYKALREEMYAAAANARLELPPAQETWTAWLAERKKYRYYSEYSNAYHDYYNDIHTYSSGHRRIEWDFHGDRTCESRDQSSGGISSYATDSWLAGYSRDSETGGRHRFEVRGSDEKELWIVVRRPGGSTFHRMNPNDEGTFHESKPKGLSIDGRIEGKYGSANDTGYWKKSE